MLLVAWQNCSVIARDTLTIRSKVVTRDCLVRIPPLETRIIFGVPRPEIRNGTELPVEGWDKQVSNQ